jgi:hypothetical protein
MCHSVQFSVNSLLSTWSNDVFAPDQLDMLAHSSPQSLVIDPQHPSRTLGPGGAAVKGSRQYGLEGGE